MLIIHSPSNNPYENIATEEYLLENKNEDIFLLYINSPSVIVGKFQNSLAEINTLYVKKNNIKVVRRLSGGGAVYHDKGNLNFSFQMPYSGEKFSDFKKFTQPIIDFLNTLGLKADLSGRNDIIIDSKKFSGNAKFIFKNKKLLQHGTILINSELSKLSKSLSVRPQQFEDKATQSVRSQVTNLIDYLPQNYDITTFSKELEKYILTKYPDAKPYKLSDREREAIKELARKKYETWEWNFGKSPNYKFQKKIKLPAGSVEFQLETKEGIIEDIQITPEFTLSSEIKKLEKLLKGKRHNPDSIALTLASTNFEEYLGECSINEIIKGLF